MSRASVPELEDRNQSPWVQSTGTNAGPRPQLRPLPGTECTWGGAEQTGSWRVGADTFWDTQHGPKQAPDTPSIEAALGSQENGRAGCQSHCREPAQQGGVQEKAEESAHRAACKGQPSHKVMSCPLEGMGVALEVVARTGTGRRLAVWKSFPAPGGAATPLGPFSHCLPEPLSNRYGIAVCRTLTTCQASH